MTISGARLAFKMMIRATCSARKTRWPPSMVLLLGLTLEPLSFAQFSFGVKGGLPIPSAIQTHCEFNAELNSLLAPCYSANTKRYIVGPTVEFRVLPQWAVELDALYNRTDYSGAVGIPSPIYPIGIGVISSRAVVNSWEFPIMVKHRFSLGGAAPFIDAGPSFRYVGVSSQATSTIFGAIPNVNSFTTDHPNETPEPVQRRFYGGRRHRIPPWQAAHLARAPVYALGLSKHRAGSTRLESERASILAGSHFLKGYARNGSMQLRALAGEHASIVKTAW